jgi:hypothetical protein
MARAMLSKMSLPTGNGTEGFYSSYLIGYVFIDSKLRLSLELSSI